MDELQEMEGSSDEAIGASWLLDEVLLSPFEHTHRSLAPHLV
jgi:hypothetical protein